MKFRARKLLEKIEGARKRGRRRRVRRLVKLYLRSVAGRVRAVALAAQRVDPDMSPQDVLRVARQINVWHRCEEPAYFRNDPKPNGGFRTTCRFGLVNQARQLLVRDVLTAALELPPFIYDVRGRGGTRAGGQVILDNMRRGYRWAVVADVASCFPSFSRRGVPRMLPLPREVVWNVLFADGLNLVPESSNSGHQYNSAVCRGHPQCGPAGLPQGSRVSNLVASLLLSVLGQALTGDVVLVMFRDDIVVLARTRREADAVVSALYSALHRHPAGPLLMKRCDVRRVADGFDFLGYRFQDRYGIASATPSDKNFQEIQHRCLRAYIDDVFSGHNEPLFVEAVCRRWLAAFPLWRRGSHVVDRMIAEYREALLAA
jgi:hypothetical protein